MEQEDKIKDIEEHEREVESFYEDHQNNDPSIEIYE
jgi:hypothetical protein